MGRAPRRPYLPRTLGPRIEEAGFAVRAPTAGVVEAWADDLRRLAAGGSSFFSLDRYLFLVDRPV